MSSILIVREPDPERRRTGLSAVRTALRRFDLDADSLEHGPIGIAWATFPGAPLSRAPGAFVLGELIEGPGPGRLSAADYAARVAAAPSPPPLDGYAFAATYDAHGALTVAVDILGQLPVYHATSGSALLVATSPGLITAWPGFTAAHDAMGLAALLITNGSFRGRTPYRGIRRLAKGHALVAAPGAPAREVHQYAITLHRESHGVPPEESAQRLYEAFVAAAKRHVPTDVTHSMLLSGGLDSRLITGVLARQGVPLELITRGEPDELEYHCARAVARRLGLKQFLVPHPVGTFEHFERNLWWDGMDSAPGGGGGGLGDPIPHARRHLVAGYSADPILGGVTVGKSFDRATRAASFEHYLRRTNVWGVPLDRLPQVVRRDVFGDSVETTIAELREDYLASGDDHLERSWVFTMQLRERFTMGRMWCRLALRAWPRIPQVDREVLRVASGIPMPVMAGRRLEYAMLERFHTDLARLPLDRNDLDVTPPLAGAMDLIRAGIDRSIRRLRQKLGIPRPERRYYHRTYDFNGEAWGVIRRGAEADRERAYGLFERAAFDAIVPRAGTPLPATGVIEDSSGAKMLLALAVWLRVGLGA